eukprot:Gb_25100 [translate_table: standard]
MLRCIFLRKLANRPIQMENANNSKAANAFELKFTSVVRSRHDAKTSNVFDRGTGSAECLGYGVLGGLARGFCRFMHDSTMASWRWIHVDRICTLFLDEGFRWNPNLENALNALLKPRFITPSLVAEVLHRDRNYANLAIPGAHEQPLPFLGRMLSDAERIMIAMAENGVAPDTVTYSTLLDGHCKKGKVLRANQLLGEMLGKGCFPNAVTYNILVQSVCKEGSISDAEQLLQKMRERCLSPDTHAASQELLDSNKSETCLPDIVTYSTVINGLCKEGRLDEAKRHFVEMLEKCLVPDVIAHNTLIDGFSQQGELSRAFRVFKVQGDAKARLRSYYWNLQFTDACYTMLMNCLCEGGRVYEAQALLDKMQQNAIAPNVSLFNTRIDGFCKAEKVDEAWKRLERAETVHTPDVLAYGMLFNELCKNGRLLDAQNVFDIILQQRFDLDGISYIVLISHLCKGDELEETKAVLSKMHEVAKLAHGMMQIAIRHDEVNRRTVVQPQEDLGSSEKYWRSLLRRIFYTNLDDFAGTSELKQCTVKIQMKMEHGLMKRSEALHSILISLSSRKEGKMWSGSASVFSMLTKIVFVDVLAKHKIFYIIRIAERATQGTLDLIQSAETYECNKAQLKGMLWWMPENLGVAKNGCQLLYLLVTVAME